MEGGKVSNQMRGIEITSTDAATLVLVIGIRVGESDILVFVSFPKQILNLCFI
jgi:hypothetical protein